MNHCAFRFHLFSNVKLLNGKNLLLKERVDIEQLLQQHNSEYPI